VEADSLASEPTAPLCCSDRVRACGCCVWCVYLRACVGVRACTRCGTTPFVLGFLYVHTNILSFLVPGNVRRTHRPRDYDLLPRFVAHAILKLVGLQRSALPSCAFLVDGFRELKKINGSSG
jgi:hypothetical protein